ncbi:acetyltransferase protein [Chaetomidium leptoderma]|uniref:Acetyltransferase protein n=1 Tax=Chaetomidium leptoderma TaxID=669021 RepID=A0AAN6VM22_9PEZI|nr:acetyltransferase protein [Chaetomidium leptoderma]
MSKMSDATVTIRKACAADAQSITKLGADVFTSSFGHSVQPHELQAYLDSAYSLEAITQDLADPLKDTIAAVGLNGELFGFALVTRGSSEPCVSHLEDKIELQRIYVDSAAHGMGIGGLLSRAADELARQKGFRNMWLGVWEENHNAQKAYERWGYKQVGKHDFVIGTVVQTDYIMAKTL